MNAPRIGNFEKLDDELGDLRHDSNYLGLLDGMMDNWTAAGRPNDKSLEDALSEWMLRPSNPNTKMLSEANVKMAITNVFIEMFHDYDNTRKSIEYRLFIMRKFLSAPENRYDTIPFKFHPVNKPIVEKYFPEYQSRFEYK